MVRAIEEDFGEKDAESDTECETRKVFFFFFFLN